MKTGRFIISLDFELLWGVRDKRTIEDYGENILGVRKVIPALLQIFDQYGIKATFATVGFLFSRNKEELLQYKPQVLPRYSTEKYSPYANNYLEHIGIDEDNDLYHYAASLISLIKQYPEQEIASHTFSHFYCLEQASLTSFEADIAAAKQIAAANGVDLKSMVFPRNQYSQDHIEVCRKMGFTSFRGNETSFIYKPRQNEEQNRLIRAARLLDAYINLTGHHSFSVQRSKSGIVDIPASRFLRPYNPKLASLNKIMIHRIKSGMTYAAKRNECYHLWWHPHNFGKHLQENLQILEEILKHYQVLHKSLGWESKSMKEIAEEIESNEI